MERIEQIRLIVDYMGFQRKFPNMSIDKGFSRLYFCPKADKTFDDSLYVSGMKSTTTNENGLIAYETVCIRSVFDIELAKFDSSYA